MFDNIQMMPLAHIVRRFTVLLPYTLTDLALIAQRLESMNVHQAHIIKHTMQVRELFIDVDCQQELVLILRSKSIEIEKLKE